MVFLHDISLIFIDSHRKAWYNNNRGRGNRQYQKYQAIPQR